MSKDQVSLVERLALQHKGLGELLTEHLREHDTVLPYVYFADLVAWSVAEYGKGNHDDVREICRFLEDEYSSGDEEVRTLISLGFLENLPSTGMPEWTMRDLLGPILSAEYMRVNW